MWLTSVEKEESAAEDFKDEQLELNQLHCKWGILRETADLIRTANQQKKELKMAANEDQGERGSAKLLPLPREELDSRIPLPVLKVN